MDKPHWEFIGLVVLIVVSFLIFSGALHLSIAKQLAVIIELLEDIQLMLDKFIWV